MIDDNIPSAEIILVANVSENEPATVTLSFATLLSPVYLVINILGITGINWNERYAVFKICVHELLKNDLVMERDGDFILTLCLENDRVYIVAEKNKRYLNREHDTPARLV